MNAINKFFLVFSVVAFSAFAQAEGVSQEDIDRGNNPAIETVELGISNSAEHTEKGRSSRPPLFLPAY